MAIKTDDRSYERDEETQALLNTDATALAHSRNARQRAARASQVERDVVELRKQLDALTARVDTLTPTI
jgi:cell division protein FtsB